MKPGPELKFSLAARLRSFSCAFKGLLEMSRGQFNFRIHFVAVIVVVCCGFIFKVSFSEWTILILCMGFVLAAEAMNTAIEYLVDLVTPDYHELAGKIKDLAAAAVLIAAMASALAGLIIFVPKIMNEVW